jgi:hypothetical protein
MSSVLVVWLKVASFQMINCFTISVVSFQATTTRFTPSFQPQSISKFHNAHFLLLWFANMHLCIPSWALYSPRCALAAMLHLSHHVMAAASVTSMSSRDVMR